MMHYRTSICSLCLFCYSALSIEAPFASSIEPYLLPLLRESVPVKRKGKVVSHKTSYSGAMHVGIPAQEFRVVFDTGSGHVVLPAKECESISCRMHRQYDALASRSSVAINADGSVMSPGQLSDTATIGYGTGSVTGEFVREQVCVGDASSPGPCMETQAVMAVEMSDKPFKSFTFDGIFGLGLDGLALSSNFSFMGLLASSASRAQFAVYIDDTEGSQDSEIAFGGYNAARLTGPLSWVPAAKPELGHWQVAILGVRISGMSLDMCHEGCHGIMDTGTSHIGIPAMHEATIAELLTVAADADTDCRMADAPSLELELPGLTLQLLPEDYMRPLPLRQGIEVSSAGVALPGADVPTRAAPTSMQVGDESHCRPKLTPVRMPAPLGPELFILGEPVLRRYYTVFDREGPQIGFGHSIGRGPPKGGSVSL